MNEMLAAYLEDLKDSLLLFNESLMKLQKGDTGSEVVNGLFRVAHTIKGNSAAVEFYNIEKVMHNMEDILHEVRSGSREISDQIMSILFECLDFLEDCSKVIIEEKSDKNIETKMLLKKLETIKTSNKQQVKRTTSELIMPIDCTISSFPIVDLEILDLMIDNCKRGYSAYKITVDFNPNCTMKSVRSWMIFEKIDACATFMFSTPDRVEEENFKNGEFEFEGTMIDLYILTDKEIEIIRNEILLIADINEVLTQLLPVSLLEIERKKAHGEVENRLIQSKTNQDEILNLPNVDLEMLNVMIENCKRGYDAYRITVEIKPNSTMKSVRSWMIFEKIDSLATFMFSRPERVNEEDFKNGGYEFDGSKIQIFALCEKDINLLKNVILNTVDVIDVRMDFLAVNWLETERERITAEKKILYMIKDVEINLLSMEKKEINKSSLEKIEGTITEIIATGTEVLDNFIIDTSNEILKLVKQFEKNESRVEAYDIEMIALLIHHIERIIRDSKLLSNDNLINEINNIISDTKKKFIGSPTKIGEILTENKVMGKDDIEDILKKQKESYPDLKFGQVAVKENKASAYEMMKGLKDQTTNKDVSKDSGFIRVPVNKVDGLMDMLGELLILNAQMEQKIVEIVNGDSGLNNVLSRSAKLIRGIQGLSMSLRMVEIKPTLHRLTRIARDTAAELNKKIEVTIEGEETEIDRSASEKLFDPLMHLIRNAVSHGIEDESDRVSMGKNPVGKVEMRVYSKRGNVYIEVEDDGKGLDLDRIYKKAKSQGLIEEGKEYTEDEIVRFIFHPGFTTQEVANNISGRGVGMNVVESEINKVGGKVEVINKSGHGAIFVLRIPMNLAVINGTIVEISGGRYIVPTLFIKEFFIPKKENWISMQGKNKAIRIRENVIPIITSKEVFGIKYEFLEKEDNEIIVLELEQKYLAFPVDKIISRQEIVSKPLDREFSSIGFASGASILGDGQVSLIIDVEAIFKMTNN